MIKEIRATAKGLYGGNIFLFCLYFAVCIMMIFCINLLPLAYEEFVSASDRYVQWKYANQLDFFASVVLFILSAFVYYSLSSSVTRCFMKRAKGEDVGTDDVFYFFSLRRALENFGLRVCFTFIKLTAKLFFMLPFSACLSVLLFLLSSSVSSQVCFFVSAATVVFFITGLIFYRRFSCLLFLYPFMICTDEKSTIKSMIRTSVRIMKDQASVIREIRRSFIGYFLLCVLIIPAGYVWVYYRQTIALASVRFLKDSFTTG